MMNREFTILMVEDDVEDAELIQRLLRRDGLRFTCKTVFTREEFLKELNTRRPDIIFSDHGLPTFDGAEARRLARRLSPKTPFIFVTGGVGELRTGELEYRDTRFVQKNEVSKLSQMVKEVLEQNECVNDASVDRSAAADPSLRSAPSLDHASRCANVLINESGEILSWNGGARKLLGYDKEDVLGQPLSSLFPKYAIERRFVEQLLHAATKKHGFRGELILQSKDRSQVWCEVSIQPLLFDSTTSPAGFAVIVNDLPKTEHSRAAQPFNLPVADQGTVRVNSLGLPARPVQSAATKDPK